MACIAFEVYLNGERQFTAGTEEWESILAIALAQRVDPDVGKLRLRDDEKPSDPSMDIRFRTRVHERTGEQPHIGSDGLHYGPIKTGTYPSLPLSEGDVVEIRVVRTNSADTPEWLTPDRARGPVIRSITN